MTHRDGLPRFSARSVRCGDAGHREACATPGTVIKRRHAAVSLARAATSRSRRASCVSSVATHANSGSIAAGLGHAYDGAARAPWCVGAKAG